MSYEVEALRLHNRSILSKRILDTIPYDGWVLASEIAAKLGVGSHRVGNIIGRKLLYVEVERKPMKDNKETPYLYRRIKHVPPRKHTNAAAVSKDGMRRSLKQSSE